MKYKKFVYIYCIIFLILMIYLIESLSILTEQGDAPKMHTLHTKYTLKRYETTISVSEYFEKYVNVAEFLEYCKVCPNYDRLWSCPSYDFSQEAYWKEYRELFILGYKICFDEAVSKEESMEIMEKVKADIGKELFELEEIFPGSISLSAGSCSVCGKQNCTRPSGKPCRYPDKLRYSIESIGGNVGKTVHDLLGIELEWIQEDKVPNYFVLIGGLLKK